MLRVPAFVVAVLVAGCTPSNDQNGEETVAKADIPQTVEEPAKELGPSTPEDFFADDVEVAGAKADKPQTVEESRRELDLSIPEEFFADDVEVAGDLRTERFDAAGLFDHDDDKSVNVIVMPRFEDARDDQGFPEVDGATVTVETKTR